MITNRSRPPDRFRRPHRPWIPWVFTVGPKAVSTRRSVRRPACAWRRLRRDGYLILWLVGPQTLNIVLTANFVPSIASRTDLSNAHENPRTDATDDRHCRVW